MERECQPIDSLADGLGSTAELGPFALEVRATFQISRRYHIHPQVNTLTTHV